MANVAAERNTNNQDPSAGSKFKKLLDVDDQERGEYRGAGADLERSISLDNSPTFDP